MLRSKLRFKFPAWAFPLIAAAILAGVRMLPNPRACTATNADTLEMSSAPWHADLHISPTDEPSPAMLHVAASDDAAVAAGSDVTDHIDDAGEVACEATPSTQFVAVSTRPTASGL
jgi:hypothetical protein